MSFTRHQSAVGASKFIWAGCGPAVEAKDSQILFAKASVIGREDKGFKCKQVDPNDPSGKDFVVPDKHAYNTNEGCNPLDFNDPGLLPHYNVAAVLDFFKVRLLAGVIYTYVDPLLVVVNPFDRDLGTKETSTAKVLLYRDCPDLGKLPPHIFALARIALADLHGVGKSQTMIVSGESGAGKTESSKHIMKYFAESGKGQTDNTIQDSVMAANPILEAFGNAKTIHNNNSSRFGRFMRLLLAREGGIMNGSVEGFLLERLRVVSQEEGERNFHIFYQLVKGATPDMKKKYGVRDLKSYEWLAPSGYDAPGIDDVDDFKQVVTAFTRIGLSAEEIDQVLSTVSGVLLCGSVKIVDGKDGNAEIKSSSRPDFEEACRLLYLDPKLVEDALTFKTLSIKGQADQVVPFKKAEADNNMRSLAKGIFNQLFIWLTVRINRTIEPKSGEFKLFMGMLDIFGFEVFNNNSLEQMFINITNEMLQKNFIHVVFTREQAIYRAEGISEANLHYTSNDAVIDTLCHKKNSVLAALADTCVGTTKTDQRFVAACYELTKPLGTNKLKKPKIDADIRFIIAHTIGDIVYNGTDFVFKNMDSLRPEFVSAANQSSGSVMREMFDGVVVPEGKIGREQLISSVFLKNLEVMMGIIDQTEPHFIRCVKPNDEKKARTFNQVKVNIQLHALSILEALHLRDLGFSYRRRFGEFLKQFKSVNVGITTDIVKELEADPDADIKNLEKYKAASIALLRDAGIPKNDYECGKTMTFMTKDGVRQLAAVQRERMATYQPAVEMIESSYKRYLYRQEFVVRVDSLKRIQAHCRKHLDMAAAA